MRLAGARRGAVSGWVELRPRAAVSAPTRRLKRLPAGGYALLAWIRCGCPPQPSGRCWGLHTESAHSDNPDRL